MMDKRNVLMCGSMLAASVGLALPARGSIVALYDFPTSQGTTLPSASTDSEPTSTAGGLGLGAGLPTGTGTTVSGISSTTGNPVNALFLRNSGNTVESAAVTQNKYFTFTVTPTTGLNFTSLDFQWYRQTTDAATNFSLRIGEPGDANDDFVTIASGTMSGAITTFHDVSLDLTGVASLQNVTTATTFRFYVWGATGSDPNTRITRYDNIELNATLIPEPATLVLLALGGLVMSPRSQRRD